MEIIEFDRPHNPILNIYKELITVSTLAQEG